MDHLAAAEHRVHRVEDLGLPVEAPRGGGPEHLVTAERQELAVERRHVDRMVRRELRPVDGHDRSDGVRGVDQLAQRRDRAERVRHAGDGQDLRPLGEERAQVGQVELAVVRERDVLQGGARDGDGHLPRHDVRVVLHLGEQHLIALAQELAAPSLRDQVHRLRGSAREHDRLGPRGAEEPGEVRASALEELGGLLAQHVEASMRVRVVVRVEVGHRVDHLLRLLRRGGAVQVDERPVAHRAREDGEVLADPLDVQSPDVPRHGRLRLNSRRSRPLPGRARRGRPRTPWPRARAPARRRRSSRYDPSSSRGPYRA